MKENKNKKVKVISITLILLLIILVVLSFAYTQNMKQAKNNNEEQKVEESKAQDIILEDNKYMHVETDASGDKVPVPNGFVGSKVSGENEINTGYVIYEGEEIVDDNNVEEAQKQRNQYVWIPVTDISKLYGTDKNGKRWGKIYSFTTSTNPSDIFDDTTGTYENNWSESDGIMSILNYSSYKEPDVVTNINTTIFDMDSRLRTLNIGAETTHEFQMQLEKEFSAMIDSVEKYGGFYIGRYETGNLSEEVALIQKGNDDISNQNWYTMYEKCKTLDENNKNIKTGMIWGCQFDRVVMWLIESGCKTKEEIINNSTSWGNFQDSSFTYTNVYGDTVLKDNSIRIPAGSTDYTKANNIYDLAGNVSDWTIESWSNGYRVTRGGFYSNNGNNFPFRSHSNNPLTRGNGIGCRVSMYIKY